MSEFEKIYKAYFTDVYLYIRSISGNDSIAEEITAETFFRALSKIDSFRRECEIRVWLCQIAKNLYFSYLKKNKKLSLSSDFSEFDIPDAPSPEESVIRRNEAERALNILHTFSEPYREVFMLRVYGELSFSEIAKIFKKSENWACVTYHRAKEKIKEKL